MSLALCMVIARSARWRPRVAAAMTAFSVAVCYSFLELEWHYPSDVLGGFLVAATWTLLAAAALDLVDARWPRRWGRPSGPAGNALAGRGAGADRPAGGDRGDVAGSCSQSRAPHAVMSYASDHEAFMIGAAAIAALGMPLATGAMLALRLSVPAGPRQTRRGPITAGR